MEIAAREAVKGSAEAEGPQTIIAREADLKNALPDAVPEQNWLAGRICLTKEEVALALGIGVIAVERATSRGELPSLLLGGRRLYPVKAIEEHLRALAYAGSGALDQWERAMVQATAARMKITQRRIKERNRYLKRRLAKAGGIVTDQDAADMRALVAELDQQQILAHKQREKLMAQIEAVERGTV